MVLRAEPNGFPSSVYSTPEIMEWKWICHIRYDLLVLVQILSNSLLLSQVGQSALVVVQMVVLGEVEAGLHRLGLEAHRHRRVWNLEHWRF